MSFETSFDSKQPKLEPKLFSALSETKCLFGCFASIPKQRVSMFQLNRNKQKTNRNSLIGSIFCFFYRKFRVFPVLLGFFRFFRFLRFFRFFSVFFGFSRNSLFRLFRFYTETESFDVSIEPKQTEDPSKQFKREYIWVFFRKFRANRNKRETDLVSVCFGSNRNLFLFVSRTP